MGAFSKYPYHDFADKNLDFIMRIVNDSKDKIERFIQTSKIEYAPAPFNIWDRGHLYGKSQVVNYNNDSYLSLREVPAGVEITNEDYWLKIGLFNEQVEELSKKLERLTIFYVTPEQFGAYGDGIHDDTDAIKAALESGATVIEFGNHKTYNVKQIKADFRNVIINGNGSKLNGTDIDMAEIGNHTSTVLTNYTDGFTPSSVFENGFLVINDLEIDANADEVTSYRTPYAVFHSLGCAWLWDFETVRINRCWFHHTYNGSACQLCNCNDVVVEGCKITNIGYAQEHNPGNINPSTYEWDGIYGLKRDVADSVILKSLIIKNCTFEDMAGSAAEGQNTAIFRMIDCKVDNVRGYMCEDNTTIAGSYVREFGNMIADKISYIIASTHNKPDGVLIDCNIHDVVATNIGGDKDNDFTSGGSIVSFYNSSDPYKGFVKLTVRDSFFSIDRGTYNITNYPTRSVDGINISEKGELTISNVVIKSLNALDTTERDSIIAKGYIKVRIKDVTCERAQKGRCIYFAAGNADEGQDAIIKDLVIKNTSNWNDNSAYNAAILTLSKHARLVVENVSCNKGIIAASGASHDSVILRGNKNTDGALWSQYAGTAPAHAWVFDNDVVDGIGITALTDARFVGNNIVTP